MIFCIKRSFLVPKGLILSDINCTLFPFQPLLFGRLRVVDMGLVVVVLCHVRLEIFADSAAEDGGRRLRARGRVLGRDRAEHQELQDAGVPAR